MRKIIIGEKYKTELEDALIERSFKCIWMPQNPSIDIRLASHCDLSVFKFNEEIVLSRHLVNNEYIVNQLTNNDSVISESQPQYNKYPGDANLCACAIGNYIIHNNKITDKKIKQMNSSWINVNQGYSRCAICVVDNKSIITSDIAIANAVQKIGFEVLLIEPSGIQLEGFDYGFIGGSSFTDDRCIYFTGVLDNLSDKEQILTYITKRGKKADFLTDKPLFDIGSAIIIN